MREEDDRPDEKVAGLNYCFAGKDPASPSTAKSLIRFQSKKFYVCDSKNDLYKTFHEANTSTSRTGSRGYSKSRGQDPEERYKMPVRVSQINEGRVFSTPEFLVNDCWKAASAEIPVKLAGVFRERELEEEDDSADVGMGKPKLGSQEEKLSYTKEYHLLSEVQKARILVTVEEAIKKLANSDLQDFGQVTRQQCPDSISYTSTGGNLDKHLCRKFLLPWVLMKVLDLVLCHIIQVAFLSSSSYFDRKKDFLPVVVTYYLTLFIIIISMVVHVGCYTYVGAHNPCYFMCTVSLSILTLTTVVGVLIMLCSMEFYTTFREIFVLVLIGALLFSLVVELCICYIQVKNFWNKARHATFYIP